MRCCDWTAPQSRHLELKEYDQPFVLSVLGSLSSFKLWQFGRFILFANLLRYSWLHVKAFVGTLTVDPSVKP